MLGAHAIEVAVDGHCVAPICSLEGHVFEEVRYAGDVGRFVAAARLDDEPGRDRKCAVGKLGDDFEPVVERGVFEIAWC